MITSMLLPASDLALWQRLDPAGHQMQHNRDDTNDPDGLGIVLAVESEDYGEDNTSGISNSTDYTRQKTVGMWVNVWDQTFRCVSNVFEKHGKETRMIVQEYGKGI